MMMARRCWEFQRTDSEHQQVDDAQCEIQITEMRAMSKKCQPLSHTRKKRVALLTIARLQVSEQNASGVQVLQSEHHVSHVDAMERGLIE
jgi:hypothetical protein